EIATSGRPVVLVGPNGAGKTNVLDALSLLSPGRGLRGAKLGEHIRKGPSIQSDALWAVAATVSRDGEDYEIGTGLTLGPNGGERRQLRLNGAPAASTADLSEIGRARCGCTIEAQLTPLAAIRAQGKAGADLIIFAVTRDRSGYRP